MGTETCDTLVIGAGPSGLASAVELLRSTTDRVLVIDMGEAIGRRSCKLSTGASCSHCASCALLSGVGGASGVLGGKLCFFPAGDQLAQHTGYSSMGANATVLSFMSRYGLRSLLCMPQAITCSRYSDTLDALHLKYFDAYPRLRPVLQRLFYRLCSKIRHMGGSVKSCTKAMDILPGNGDNRFAVPCVEHGERMRVLVRKAVIVATGRAGAQWLSGIASGIGIVKNPTSVDVGVRLELPSQCFDCLPPNMQDPKFKIWPGTPREIRTLCWCRGGQMVITNADGICLADGHFGDRRYHTTSVSIVARVPAQDDSSPLAYARQQFAGLHAGKGVLHQSLQGFLSIRGRRGKCGGYAIESRARLAHRDVDLRLVMKPSIVDGIIQMVEHLNGFLGGALVNCGDGDLYAPVIDRFWDSPVLSSGLMTSIAGLYVTGDATGLARGIVQGLFSGIVAANTISRHACKTKLVSSNDEIVLGK